MKTTDPVQNYVKQHESRFVKELLRYLSFPSISRNRPDVYTCAKWLEEHARNIGLHTKLYKTKGNPIVLATTFRKRSSDKPHFVVYGHYDVQPPGEPKDWKTKPFSPEVKCGKIFGRGASDNKGQHFVHLKAVEAYLRTGRELPCDVTFLIEGEEEIGSGSLVAFLERQKKRLACNAVIISDTEAAELGVPALTCSARGIVELSIVVRGPKRNLHSGTYGGSVENPALALCKLLAQVRDEHGQITIPGFYDDVVMLSSSERKALNETRDDGKHLAETGAPLLFGEAGFTYLEQIGARPTFEVNLLASGDEKRTIIPRRAEAYITMRVVCNQDPRAVAQLAVKYLTKLCPKTVQCSIQIGGSAKPFVLSPESRLRDVTLSVLRESFGREPLLLRGGGSIPVIREFSDRFRVDVLLVGLGLPSDNIHAPNEKFELDHFRKGVRMSALLWERLSKEIKAC